MKLFISYKSEDYEEVKNVLELFRSISPDVQISSLRKSRRWKSLAKKHIAKADFVIYLAGEKYSQNIDYEIDAAIKYGHKVHCAPLKDGVKLDAKLFIEDEFDKTKTTPKVTLHENVTELVNFIRGDTTYLSDNLFGKAENTDTAALIEQYKVMLSTSESLIDRRQRLTTTYLAIFSALLPVISAMLSLKFIFLYIGAALISVICIILCSSWRNTIISYGKSNRAKFAVLEEVEKKLPAAMFASEWLALKKLTVKYKSFTDRETIIPVLFIVVYVVLLAVSVTFMCLSF